MGIEAIKQELHGLSPQELKEIAAAATGLMSLKGDNAEKVADASRKSQMLYDAMRSGLDKYHIQCPPIGVLATSDNSRIKETFRALQEATHEVDEFLEASYRSRKGMTRSKRMWFYNLLVKLGIQQIKGNGKILNLRTLCYAVQRAEHIIDQAFPGYVSMGMLAHVIDAAEHREYR